MSVTYPADATATTYLFTLRGKVNTPTVADARICGSTRTR